MIRLMNRNWKVVTSKTKWQDCRDRIQMTSMNAQDIRNAQRLGKVDNLCSLWRKMKGKVLFKKPKLDPNLPFPSLSFWITKDHNLPHKTPVLFSPWLHLYVLSLQLNPDTTAKSESYLGHANDSRFSSPQLWNWSALQCHPRLPGSTSKFKMLYTLCLGKSHGQNLCLLRSDWNGHPWADNKEMYDKWWYVYKCNQCNYKCN